MMIPYGNRSGINKVINIKSRPPGMAILREIPLSPHRSCNIPICISIPSPLKRWQICDNYGINSAAEQVCGDHSLQRLRLRRRNPA
jgi:hypothetical protein